MAKDPLDVPLSPAAEAALDRGLQSAIAEPTVPERLVELRAIVATFPSVKVERVEASEKTETKAHVKASWGNKRVAHVAEKPFTLDDAERAVLEVVVAHHAA